MTLVEEQRGTALPVTQDEEVENPKRQPSANVRRRVVVLSTLVLAAAVAVALVFVAFEGPIERIWYTTRQHDRAADFNGFHPHTGAGRAIAVVQIPRLRLNVMVAEGDSAQDLRGGPGHLIGTPLPGALGNSVILGHRHAWGGPFADLPKLRRGDLVAVETHAPDGSLPIGVFTVTSVRTVAAADSSPFAPSRDHRITLVTGAGGHFGSRRLVVTAVSGAPSKSVAVLEAPRPSSKSPGVATSGGTALVLFGVIGAVVAWLMLRRRYGALALAAVVGPLVVIGVLGILLDVDLLLPALR